MNRKRSGLGRCRHFFWLGVVFDTVGVVMLFVGIFAELIFYDMLLYMGSIIIFLSLLWWVSWYTGNIELLPEETLGLASSNMVSALQQSVSRRFSWSMGTLSNSFLRIRRQRQRRRSWRILQRTVAPGMTGTGQLEQQQEQEAEGDRDSDHCQAFCQGTLSRTPEDEGSADSFGPPSPDSEPEKLVHHIFQDMHKTKKKKTRVILRMLPIAGTCKAFLEDMKKYAETFLEPWFKAPNKGTFQIVYKSRNNSHVNREEVIKELAGIVGSLNSENKVDLTNLQYTVVVEIITAVCCLSVVKDYMLFRKYNLQEVVKSPKDPSQLHPKQGNGKEAKLESDDKLNQSDPAEGRNNQQGVPDSSEEKTKPVTETQVVHEGETNPEPASQVTDGSESNATDVS